MGHSAWCPQFDLDHSEVGGRIISLRYQPGTRLPSLCPAAQANGAYCSLVLGLFSGRRGNAASLEAGPAECPEMLLKWV